jgi:hypothetical protein
MSRARSKLQGNWRLTRRHFWLGAAALAGATLLSPQLSFAEVVTPKPGTALRAEVLNALRPRVVAEIGGAIDFKVDTLRVLQDWAFVSAKPQRPGGASIDWLKTKFREQWQAGQGSDVVLALLKREGGAWTVVECDIGPTDVAWLDWIEKDHAPRLVFTDDPNIH